MIANYEKNLHCFSKYGYFKKIKKLLFRKLVNYAVCVLKL